MTDRLLLTDLSAATMPATGGYGLIRDAAILIEDTQIAWVGPVSKAPNGARTKPLGGRLVTPALIDCHTHIVFGGNRAAEFEMRQTGASYAEIARAGGGIMSTVNATRAASDADLLRGALARVDAMIAEGVAVIEVKSGYGLDVETELRMLRIARQIADERPVEIRTSFLGAHAIPAEFKGDADGYIDQVCIPALHAAHAEGLVDAVDGFCENIAFSTPQIGRVFEVARTLGLPVKLHAEQLSAQGGTALAVKFGALSADHLEYASSADAREMARAGTVAVLLPGAFYTLHETQMPPIAAFREAGVPMALATDCNPGSSPMTSILLAMNMGCTLFGMTPTEALAGVTCHAARALGIADAGRIAAGARADLAIWDVHEPAELAYLIGTNRLHRRIFKGVF